ncbi:MAG: helix-turn-helix domain-containing protein [Archangium sp.]
MTDYVQFGKWLREQRQLRALSVDEIASRTKISPTLVAALEEGERERFPERIFLLNYLRSYATVVGLSADEVVNRFDEMPSAPKAEAFDPKALEVDRRERASTAMWSTIAAIVVVIALLGLNSLHELAIRFTHR